MLARNYPPCGARARSRRWQPCQAPPVLNPETGLPAQWEVQVARGRSTGPRGEEGKRRIAEAQRRRWQRYATGLETMAVA